MGRKRKWIRFTQSCSGCHETNEGQPTGNYPYDEKAGCYVGAGCHECGYTGKRRIEMLEADLMKTIKENQENFG